MKKAILHLFIPLLFASCYNEDYYVDPSLLPEPTLNSQPVVACAIDNWIYRSDRFNTIELRPYQTAAGNDSTVVSFHSPKDGLGQIRFSLLSTDDGKSLKMVDFYFQNHHIDDVHMEIIARRDNILLGRFSGNRVTHGRFLLHLPGE